MDAKHTTGPWVIQDNAAFGVHIYGPGGLGGGKHLARVSNSAGVDVMANARLIAAAPNMLAALKAAKQFIENGVELGFIRMPDRSTPDPAHNTLPAIKAAIAAATGSVE